MELLQQRLYPISEPPREDHSKLQESTSLALDLQGQKEWNGKVLCGYIHVRNIYNK